MPPLFVVLRYARNQVPCMQVRCTAHFGQTVVHTIMSLNVPNTRIVFDRCYGRGGYILYTGGIYYIPSFSLRGRGSVSHSKLVDYVLWQSSSKEAHGGVDRENEKLQDLRLPRNKLVNRRSTSHLLKIESCVIPGILRHMAVRNYKGRS